MPVIKANTSGSFTKDAVVLNLGDLGREATRLRMEAEAKAAHILSEAEQRAAELTRDAAAKGFDQGHGQGHEQGLAEGRRQGGDAALDETREQLQQLQTAWSDVAEQWDSQRRQMAREARSAVIQFALTLAEKLLHRVIKVDPSIIVDQVGNALAHVLRPLDVTVRIHPGDRPWLERAMPDLLAEFNQFEHVGLVDDPNIGSGGCVVTYGQGEIDATIETQLQRVIDLILPDEEGHDTAMGEKAGGRID